MDDRPLPELADLTRVVARSWRGATLLALLGAAAGALLFFQVPMRYYATSEVAMSPQLTYVSLSQEQERQPSVTLDTTAALLGSTVALDRVATAMGVSRAEARDSMTIAATPLTRVLIVQVGAATEEQAVAGANAATEALLALQSDTFALRPASVRFLKNRLALLQREAQQRIVEGSPSSALFDVADILQSRLDQATATNNTRSIVIERAQVTADRPGQLEVFIASGAVLGLTVGFTGAWFSRRRRPGYAATGAPQYTVQQVAT